MQVGKNKVVSIEYTLYGTDGQVIDSSKGRAPLVYLHGVGGLIPGLESELEGKSTGDQVVVTVPPEKAYGVRDERMVQDVPREAFKGVSEIKTGMQFQAQTPQGARIVTVVGVEGDKVKIDANHPLAGSELKFDVQIVDVREATEEEMSHGHVHGDGGHQH